MQRRAEFKSARGTAGRLSAPSLHTAVAELCERDADLALVVARFGMPPMWARPPGFASLIKIILEQQISLQSAAAAYARIQTAAGKVSPAHVAKLGEDGLRAAGITRQKAGYCSELANAIVQKRLPLSELNRASDHEVRTALLSLPGIGRWTVDIYLLMALRRPDVWPHGDLALAHATTKLKRLDSVPDYDALSELARQWAPWRGAAARLLWHYYLSEKNPNPT